MKEHSKNENFIEALEEEEQTDDKTETTTTAVTMHTALHTKITEIAASSTESKKILASAPIKVALVGDGGVGKTAFIERLMTGEFKKQYVRGREVIKNVYTENLRISDLVTASFDFEVWDIPGTIDEDKAYPESMLEQHTINSDNTTFVLAPATAEHSECIEVPRFEGFRMCDLPKKFKALTHWQHGPPYVAGRSWESSMNRFIAGETLESIAINQGELKNGKTKKSILPATVAGHVLDGLPFAKHTINLVCLAEQFQPPNSAEWAVLHSAEFQSETDVISTADFPKDKFLSRISTANAIPSADRTNEQQAEAVHWNQCLSWYLALRRVGYVPSFAQSSSSSSSSSSSPARIAMIRDYAGTVDEKESKKVQWKLCIQNLSDSKAAIIMFDVTARLSYKHVCHWHDTITSACGHIPIVLVGNKVEIKERKVNAGEVKYQKGKKDIQYYEISNKLNYNLCKPFVWLARQFAETAKKSEVMVTSNSDNDSDFENDYKDYIDALEDASATFAPVSAPVHVHTLATLELNLAATVSHTNNDHLSTALTPTMQNFEMITTEIVDKFEMRGVKVKLLRAIADHVAQKIGGEWTIGRISNVLIGTHEILKEGHRWGADVVPANSLTFEDKMSLIDVLKTHHKDASNLHPTLGVCYDDVVGERATKFCSFAYNGDFFDLVDSLEDLVLTNPDYADDYFWFDMLVNNQWVAIEHNFEWWSTTFKNAVQEIGHLVLICSPWFDPEPLKRTWCLWEIYCAIEVDGKLDVALSSKQRKDFIDSIISDGKSFERMLSKINVENSETWLLQDKESIFNVIRQSVGFDELNSKVCSRMREWVLTSIMDSIKVEYDKVVLWKKRLAMAGMLYSLNKLAEVIEILLTCLTNVVGISDRDLFSAYHLLAVSYSSMSQTVQALDIYKKMMSFIDPSSKDASIVYLCMSDIYRAQFQFKIAVNYMNKALQIGLRLAQTDGLEFMAKIYHSMGILIVDLSQHEFAVKWWKSMDPMRVYVTDKAGVYAVCLTEPPSRKLIVRYAEALKYLEKSRDIMLSVPNYGPDHPDMAQVIFQIGKVLDNLSDQENALINYKLAFSIFQKSFGAFHPATLTCKSAVRICAGKSVERICAGMRKNMNENDKDKEKKKEDVLDYEPIFSDGIPPPSHVKSIAIILTVFIGAFSLLKYWQSSQNDKSH